MKAGDPAASPERVVPTERALGGTPEQTPEADSTDDVRGKLQQGGTSSLDGRGELGLGIPRGKMEREMDWRGRWAGRVPEHADDLSGEPRPGSIETLLAQPHTATSSQHHTATSSQHHTATSSEHHTATSGGSGIARRATRVSAAVVPRNCESIVLIMPLAKCAYSRCIRGVSGRRARKFCGSPDTPWIHLRKPK